MTFTGEKIFQSLKPIKYVFQQSKKHPNFLIVVFSAFSPKGSPPVYNYIRTLEALDVNKLFILDDHGERGCYYLGENRVFEVESSVVSLITFIANQLNITNENIICCGSSKGGYASLYYAIKYGFGVVIAGAPQTKIGTYLYGAKEYPTLKYIAGDITENSIQYLDSLLYDVVSNAKQIPNIYIHVGIGDHHYKNHVVPFADFVKDKGFDVLLDLGEYSDHGEVRYYQTFLVDKLIERIPGLRVSFFMLIRNKLRQYLH